MAGLLRLTLEWHDMQVTKNRSLDGVLDQLNSRNITDAGPADLLADAPSDDDELLGPGGANIQSLSFGPFVCRSPANAPSDDDKLLRPGGAIKSTPTSSPLSVLDVLWCP